MTYAVPISHDNTTVAYWDGMGRVITQKVWSDVSKAYEFFWSIDSSTEHMANFDRQGRLQQWLIVEQDLAFFYILLTSILNYIHKLFS